MSPAVTGSWSWCLAPAVWALALSLGLRSPRMQEPPPMISSARAFATWRSLPAALRVIRRAPVTKITRACGADFGRFGSMPNARLPASGQLLEARPLSDEGGHPVAQGQGGRKRPDHHRELVDPAVSVVVQEVAALDLLLTDARAERQRVVTVVR